MIPLIGPHIGDMEMENRFRSLFYYLFINFAHTYTYISWTVYASVGTRYSANKMDKLSLVGMQLPENIYGILLIFVHIHTYYFIKLKYIELQE
jgi:hypothetical protein